MCTCVCVCVCVGGGGGGGRPEIVATYKRRSKIDVTLKIIFISPVNC